MPFVLHQWNVRPYLAVVIIFFLDTRNHDASRVTLIKSNKIYDDVHLLSGKCSTCDTKYYADHESSNDPAVQGERKRFYLNSAK